MNPEHVRHLHSVADMAYQVKFVCDLMELYLDARIEGDTGLMDRVKLELKDVGPEFRAALKDLQSQKPTHYSQEIIFNVYRLLDGNGIYKHDHTKEMGTRSADSSNVSGPEQLQPGDG